MKVIKLTRTESTNTYAKLHIDELEDKSVVHALRQTEGRGRFNRSWVDLGDENLFFSIVLKPSPYSISVLPNITQYACLILCKILENYGTNPKIKWPNDIMIDGERKISGILSETVMQGGEIKALIVGIGVNLNANRKDVENIPDRVATSLNLEIGNVVNMESFLDEFLTEFFAGYESFLEKGFESIRNEYLKRNCFLEKDLNVQVLNDVVSGYAKDLTPNGELVLQSENGEDVVLTIGDIL